MNKELMKKLGLEGCYFRPSIWGLRARCQDGNEIPLVVRKTDTWHGVYEVYINRKYNIIYRYATDNISIYPVAREGNLAEILEVIDAWVSGGTHIAIFYCKNIKGIKYIFSYYGKKKELEIREFDK